LASISLLSFRGVGHDSLILDCSNGRPLPANGLSFDGAGDTLLTILNSPANALELGELALTGSLKLEGDATGIAVNKLMLSPGGKLDLSDEDLIVHNGDISAITIAMKSAVLIGRGEKYTSLAAILNDKGDEEHTPIKKEFDGLAVGAGDVLVKYTYNGDANLDGIVNADDYFLIDSGYITQAKGYQNGDFNYDDIINADDYFLIDSAYIGQSVPLAASKPQSVVSADVAVQQNTKKAEPEGILSQLFSAEPVL